MKFFEIQDDLIRKLSADTDIDNSPKKLRNNELFEINGSNLEDSLLKGKRR